MMQKRKLPQMIKERSLGLIRLKVFAVDKSSIPTGA